VDDRPVFDQINIVVRDMPAMLQFYELLGLDIADAPPGWDAHHRTVTARGGLDVDFDSELFAHEWNEGWPAGAKGPVLGFHVAERATVDELFQKLMAAGYEAQQPPYDAFWGARYAIVVDPDGNSVGIMSASDPARRREPEPPAPA
jgi:uncharacterized glyoxalase superfamily protein PhnB